ncbi:putative calcium-dependent channel, 7TM region phosphate [Helianthus anomalus]
MVHDFVILQTKPNINQSNESLASTTECDETMVNRAGLTHWSRQEGLIPFSRRSLAGSPLLDVYETTYETCGQYWPHLHHHVVVAIIIMQITMIGFFGLKSKPAASIATILLLVATVAYNEYCKIRFLPTFYKCSVQVCMI